MHVTVTDTQSVAETEETLFTLLQNAGFSAVVVLRNLGVTEIPYRFQENNGVDWADLTEEGTLLHNTLASGESQSMRLESEYAKVRLVGNAEGGGLLLFTVTREFTRANGGTLPILALKFAEQVIQLQPVAHRVQHGVIA